jgi:FkbM family methyltransferase
MGLPRIARVTCDGFDYSIFATGDYISQQLFLKGSWGKGQQALAELLLRGADAPVVLDVGANIGLFTVPVAAIAARAGGRVLAFEPQRVVCQQLCANVFANRLDNVWAFNQAAGAEVGTVDLPTFDYSQTQNIGAFSLDGELQRMRGLEAGLDRTKTDSVAMVTLDSLEIDGRVRLLKIDVEGTEIDVLRGGRGLLEAHGFPPVMFEAWEDPAFAERRAALVAEFESLGYEITPFGRDDNIAQHAACDVQVEVRVEGDKKHLTRLR